MQSPGLRKNKGITATIIVAVILALCLYALVDPSDPYLGRFFPKCIVKSLTGLQCPACGLQRSLHAVLHGDIVGALRCNWFIIFSLSYLGGMFVTRSFRSHSESLYLFFWGQRGAWVYISLYLVWFVVRNILGI